MPILALLFFLNASTCFSATAAQSKCDITAIYNYGMKFDVKLLTPVISSQTWESENYMGGPGDNLHYSVLKSSAGWVKMVECKTCHPNPIIIELNILVERLALPCGIKSGISQAKIKTLLGMPKESAPQELHFLSIGEGGGESHAVFQFKKDSLSAIKWTFVSD